MRRARSVLLLAFLVAAALLTTRGDARAFCGFYVGSSNAPLVNPATLVVLMRDGTRTVMSMRNDYQGPPEAFAMVVPVPAVLKKENVRTLPRDLFTRIDVLGSPRLVEYWEQNPCPESSDDDKEGGTGTRAKGEEGSMGNPNTKDSRRPLVRIEAQFDVDEYEIVILSAEDSGALDAWLRGNGYHIPADAEPALRPYVAGGSKFFVAKVDPAKVRFEGGRAVLSPLRFYFDGEAFTLPIRLGLINAGAAQDLVVEILAATRYEAANYENVFIPTNLDVTDDVRGRFDEFYAALFDRSIAGKPRAVVTEYAWGSGSCDPCPGPALDPNDIDLLGGSVLQNRPGSFVLTRLHARYSRQTLGDDLVFRTAPPVVGGREDQELAVQRTDARPSSNDAFQARYVIRHRWTGPIACSDPTYGVWGGPPQSRHHPAPSLQAASDPAFAPRGKLALASAVLVDVPAIGLTSDKPTAPDRVSRFELGLVGGAAAGFLLALARRLRAGPGASR